jgi:hypothetical protein
MDTRYLTAIALTETYLPEDDDEARKGMNTGMAPEHAFAGEQTLCGVSRDDLILMRHYWRSSDSRACPKCRAALTPPTN